MIVSGIVIKDVCRLTPSYVDGALHISFRADRHVEHVDIRRIQEICEKYTGPYQDQADALAAMHRVAQDIGGLGI